MEQVDSKFNALLFIERYQDRLVKTDNRLGLSDPAVQDAIRAMLGIFCQQVSCLPQSR